MKAPAAPPAPSKHERKAARQAERQAARQHVVVNPMARATKIGAIVSGVLLLLAGGFALFATQRNKAIAAAEQAERDRIDSFVRGLRLLDLSQPTDAATFVARITEQPDTAGIVSIADEVQRMLARAQATLATAKEREEAIAAVTEVEADIAKIASLDAATMEQLRKRIDRLQPKMSIAGKAAEDRLAAARSAAAQAYVTRLVDDARAMAAREPAGGIAVLDSYRKAEDEVAALWAAETDDAAQERIEADLKQVIEESDAVAAKSFGPQQVANAPLRDLLAAAWNASEVKGFVQRVQDGALVIVGPDADAKSRAVMSIGDQEKWRDLVVEMTVERTKGTAILCFRLGSSVDASVPAVVLDVAICPENKPVRLTASLIGNQLTLTDADQPGMEIVQEVPWNMSRKGAFGIVVPPGAELRFTRLGVRVLR